MSTDLVELARFSSSAEASVVRAALESEGIRAALDGEATATWFWHLGTAVGVRLLVNRGDADRALEILASAAANKETQDDNVDDDAGDDDGESKLPADLLRAWRASLIGMLLLPPLLNIYSTWLLFRAGGVIDRCRNWRVYATCAVNVIVFSLVAWFVLLFVDPSAVAPPRQYVTPDGQPVDVKYKTKTVPIRMVP